MCSFKKVIRYLTILFCVIKNAISLELTEIIDGGRISCYHVMMKPGQRFEVDYQVIDGNGDIHLMIIDPNNQQIFAEMSKNIGRFDFQAQVMGEYRTCFNNIRDNRRKAVYFEILIDGRESDDILHEQNINKFILAAEDPFHYRIENATNRLNGLKNQLDLSLHIITLRRIMETRDKNILEHNLSLVNRWSFINLAILLTVSVIQVIMIRSLFDNQSKIRKILKSKTSW